MKPIAATYEIAVAAGHDAGDRSMRKAGRTTWNEDDYDAAVATFYALRIAESVNAPRKKSQK